MQMAVLMFRLVFDGDLCRAEALLFYFAADESAAWKAQGIDTGLNGGQVGTGSTSAPSVMSPLIPLAQSR